MKKNHLASINSDEEYIMNLALGYQVAQILFAAINMEIFTILEGGAKNVPEIAQQVEADEQFLCRFLNALVALNLLEEVNGKFLNTKSVSQHLVKGKRSYLGNAIHHSSNLWDFWGGLDTQIKSGHGMNPDEEKLKNYPHRIKDYLAAMNDFAELKAATIADTISIDNYKKMLDVGCGPGTYAIDFAARNPKIHCTIVDLEPNLVYTRETVNKSGYRDRINVLACQILEDELPGSGYDLIFISNIIHIYGEREVKTIMRKAWNAADNPGTIVIHDYLLSESGFGPLPASLFDLTMLLGTQNGKCYTMLEIKELLESLGAKHIRQIPISLGSSLVIGEK